MDQQDKKILHTDIKAKQAHIDDHPSQSQDHFQEIARLCAVVVCQIENC